MPMEYIVPSLKIATLTDMADEETINERLLNLLELEEDMFVARFHQQVKKNREKPGMIDTSKVKQSRQETLFSCMTTSLHSSRGSFACTT